MESYIKNELLRLNKAGLMRALKTVEGPQGPEVFIGGKPVTLFCSNDYLGLSNHPLVKKAAIEAIERYGVGAGASRLVSGTMEAHVMLEDTIRRFKGTEAALLFNSGYHANLGCISAIAGRETEIFSDRLNHASIADACILSRANVKRYPNRDMDSLESMLKRSGARKKLIVTDGVFSMDGTIAPLNDIVGLLDKYDAALLVDDAHGTGVLGDTGGGSLEHFGIEHPSVIQMGTLGKALGSFGAFIAGSAELIELLISRARPFIYTTALPPPVCAAAAKAFDIIVKEPELRKRLWNNITLLKTGLIEAGFDLLGSGTQIIPIVIGGADEVMEISNRLLERGIFIQGIRPPTVPGNTSRLRITLMATHTEEDIKKLLALLKEELLKTTKKCR